MAKFFSVDSKFYIFMTTLTNLTKLNLLWLLFSLPIVTIGASTIAVYDMTLKMVEDKEGHVARGFIKSFKNNLKQGVIMSFVTLLSVWATLLYFQIFAAEENYVWFYLIILVVAVYVFTLSQLYVYPLLARYQNSVFNSLKNSFRISMKYFLRTLFVIVLVAFEVAIFWFNTFTMLLGVIVGPALIMMTISGCALAIFRLIEKEPGSVVNPKDLDNDAD